MPAATPTTRRIRAVLAARGLTVADMAAAIGRNVLTLRNVITGSTIQPPTRRAISDFLDVEIWPGIKPRLSSIGFKLPTGTQITFQNIDGAKVLHSLLSPSAKREGNRVFLLDSVTVRLPATTKKTK